MKKTQVLYLTAVLVLTVSGLALAQMEKDKMGDKGMGMMGSGMMKDDMMGKGGMMGGKEMMMHGMMMKMMEKSVVATSDGGVIVMTANKLIKYDKDLNLVKEVELKNPTMEEMQKMCPMMGKMKSSDESIGGESKESAAEEKAEHESHHPENK